MKYSRLKVIFFLIGDIQPVQNPGKSWKKRLVYEDHTFNQSRTNAVYPMTHLFVDPKRFDDNQLENGNIQRTVVRTGTPVSFVYLAHFENESTFNAMNEIFHLANLPELDAEFRNQFGLLRKKMSFIVDNGHCEDPSSQLTQMCLARIKHFLRFDTVSQRSFAEYHSKRNFVERVHSAENVVLSGHGPFPSKSIHKTVETGSIQHHQNMEAMASEVVRCLRTAKFNQRSLVCHRGSNEKCFDDEATLKRFLSLTEEQKQECLWKYKPCQNQLTTDMEVLWNSPMGERFYYDDYKLINGSNSWKDKYSCTISTLPGKMYEPQPIPDYVRWLQSSGELHYCSTEQTKDLTDRLECLQECAGIFLPSRIFHHCFQLCISPPDSVLQGLAFLSWLPLNVVKKKFEILREKVEKELEDSKNRDAWGKHLLYKKNVDGLKSLCKKKGLTTEGVKFEFVRRLADEPTPTIDAPPKLAEIPISIPQLKKLSIFQLKSLLHNEGISSLGNKDELILKVFLLRNGKRNIIGENDKKDLQKTISIVEECIREQQKDDVVSQINRVRKFKSYANAQSSIVPPSNIKTTKDLQMLFYDLKLFLKVPVNKSNKVLRNCESNQSFSEDQTSESTELFFEVGSTVKLKIEDEDTPLGVGWFHGYVQSSNIVMDEITVSFFEKPDFLLTIEVTPHANTDLILIDSL